MNAKWKEVTKKEDKEEGLEVYVHQETGDIRVKYPTNVPEWAQKVAMAIYKRGVPTEKGIKKIVRGAWAYRINKAANDYMKEQDAVKKKWDEIEQRFLNRLMNREFTRWFKNHTKDTPKKEDEPK